MNELKEKSNNFFGPLFPTRFTAFIFISYMVLFINQGILVTATKNSENKYNYSTIGVVLLTEVIKLFISLIMYTKDRHLRQLIPDIISGRKVLVLYMVPAFLYCLYNNLAFVNLASYDPTTYYLLLQLRVAVTGIVYQFLFKRKLSKSQWFSLILLTIGCVVKQLSGFSRHSSDYSLINLNLLLILLQVFCSCFAGVYNEYLLKDVGSEVHLMVQNIFMYIDSIASNLFLIIITGQLYKFSELSETMTIITDPKLIAVMINNAFCGIVTSFFLKNLNSILKTFAAALELVFTAILCFFIFDIKIDIFTVISISIVSYSTYLYSRNPVLNTSNATKEDSNRNDIQYSVLKDEFKSNDNKTSIV